MSEPANVIDSSLKYDWVSRREPWRVTINDVTVNQADITNSHLNVDDQVVSAKDPLVDKPWKATLSERLNLATLRFANGLVTGDQVVYDLAREGIHIDRGHIE